MKKKMVKMTLGFIVIGMILTFQVGSVSAAPTWKNISGYIDATFDWYTGDPNNLVDGNTATSIRLDEAPGYFGVIFDSPTSISGIRYYRYGQGWNQNYITSYKIMGLPVGFDPSISDNWEEIVSEQSSGENFEGWEESNLSASALLGGVKIYYSSISYGGAATVGEIQFKTTNIFTTCDDFAEIPAVGGKYIIQNDVWGPDAGKQCISTNLKINETQSNFIIKSTDHVLDSNTGIPSSFAHVLYNCHPWSGSCTEGATFRQLSSITTVTAKWIIDGLAATGNFNAAFDIFLGETPTNIGPPTGIELMIWPAMNGSIMPGGVKVSTANIRELINGKWVAVKYDVYHAKDWGTMKHYVAYVRQVEASNGYNSVNLKDAFADSIRRGYIKSSWYLIGIEAGFEVWDGGVGLQTKNFKVNIK